VWLAQLEVHPETLAAIGQWTLTYAGAGHEELELLDLRLG
jgi:hypothetical protein